MNQMKKIDLTGGVSPGIKPFLDAAYEDGIVQDGDVLMVTKIKESNSKAGWSIHTDKFILFLFKSSPICDIVLETLADLIATNPAPGLLIEVDSSQASGFNLGLTDETDWLWSKSKKLGSTTVISVSPLVGAGVPSRRRNGK